MYLFEVKKILANGLGLTSSLIWFNVILSSGAKGWLSSNVIRMPLILSAYNVNNLTY